MGCVFCASGLNGVARNLSAGEILEQLVRLRNLLPAGERLTNIVVMGMGEPLANLDNLVAALDVATHKDGLGIGARHVTVSTVGLPQKMRRLADLGQAVSPGRVAARPQRRAAHAHRADQRQDRHRRTSWRRRTISSRRTAGG